MSSPNDAGSLQTQATVDQIGSEEAALIYQGNMVMGSKITVASFPTTNPELSFECKDLPRMDVLSKSDPFIVVYEQNLSKQWNEIGRTEVVVNSQAFS